MSDTPNLDKLMTAAEVDAMRRGKPIAKAGLPVVLARKERQKTKDQLAKDFREAVWARDKGRSRATGRKLAKSGTTDWAKLGEVDHSIPRSLAPNVSTTSATACCCRKKRTGCARWPVSKRRSTGCSTTPDRTIDRSRRSSSGAISTAPKRSGGSANALFPAPS